MDNEVIAKIEKSKLPTLPVALSDKAHKNLKRNQKRFQASTGGSISLKKLANKILETATI